MATCCEPTYQRGLRLLNRRLASLASGGWPTTALVLAIYPVDNLDPRRAVADHHYRFCAVPSFVDLDSAPFRVVLVGGPSRVVPVARSLIGQGACLLVDTVNVHLTPMFEANRFLRGRCRGQGQKETSATTMVLARGLKVKRLGHRRMSRGRGVAGCLDHRIAGIEIS
jgi:hypothetical protein